MLIAGRYRIERLIGRGGMSSVYEAADENIPRHVALKVFRPELSENPDMKRHQGEVGMLASLNHPGLVTLFDAVADDDGNVVLVLELVTGGDLRTAMDTAPLSSAEVAIIGAAVADALAYSHDRGIVHRDVKPGNILVPERDGSDTGPRAKLADFGIARLIDETRMTATGSVLGTAHYLSPEQAVGGTVGAATDVYSLGLVLLEALTGERPFPGTGVESAAARLARDPILPARLDPAWVSLLRGMTKREPGARLTATEAAELLREAAPVPAIAPASEEVLDATLRLPLSTPAARAASADESTVADDALVAPRTPSNHTAVTTVMSMQAPADRPGASSASSASTSSPVSSTEERRATTGALTALRRRPVVAIGGLIVSVIAAVLGVMLLVTVTAGSAERVDAETPPEYAVVEGTLGEHLEQLQRSVEP